MADDWKPILDSPIIEKFDKTWPFNFKWGYNAQTGQTNVWRVQGGTDGRPVHRRELERLWGREPQVRDGDVLGLATYIPAEKKLDGTIVAPPTVQIQAYYGKEIPQGVFDYFEANFPGVIARRARLARRVFAEDWKPRADIPEEVKWVWNKQNGLLIWQCNKYGYPQHDHKIESDWHRKKQADDFTGVCYVRGDDLQVIAHYFSTPSVALSEVKQELATMFPNGHIEMPSNQEAHESLGVEFHGDPGVFASARWAQSVLGGDAEMPLEGTQEPSDGLRVLGTTETPPKVLNGLRRLFSKSAFKKRSEADMDGAMIGLFVPEATAKNLKISGGEPIENMHITLCYFQDKADDRDDWDEVKKIVEQVARQTPKLTGKISGYGVFSNDVDVLWASPSIQGLAELRHKLFEACEDAGFPVDKTHDWAPHITLKYDHKGKLPKLDEEVELKFDSLSFAQGNEHDDFDFEGNFEKQTSEEFGDGEIEDFGEPWSPVPKFQVGDRVIFRSGHEGGIVQEVEQFEGGWWYRVKTDSGATVSAPEEACLRPDRFDQAGQTTLEDFGISPEGENYYRKSSEEAGPIVFATDGKDTISEPSTVPIEQVSDRFNKDYPDAEYHVSGRAIPTQDGMAYRIVDHNARTVGPGVHEVVAGLEKHLGKPCFLAEQVRP